MLKYFQVVYLFSLMHRFVWRLKFLLDDKVEKIMTVNGVVTLILVKIGRYVKCCTFLKNPRHCEIAALRVE
jgi:uncharacterized membrane protein YkvI